MANTDIDVFLIRRLLRYEAETGLLFWNERDESLFPSRNASVSWNARFAGRRAMSNIDTHGYHCGRVFGRTLLAHRVAWILHYGVVPAFIDHANGIRTDNRICNLRNVERGGNARNCAARRDNSSGVTGVNWNKRANKWAAAIAIEKKRIFLGYFDTIEDAASARLAANTKHGFSERHGRAA